MLSGDWISAPETQAVCAALECAGHKALFVGGCVRNDLLGVPVSDIDIATDALPEQTIAAAQAAGLRAVPTGLGHGTITIVSAGVPHEVTTFRRDIETDGRRAKVHFSTDVQEDAARRDFTMNALYSDAQGVVIDPLGGLEDLTARHVRFIGDAEERIKEDYLRSLRFFRFTAWYGDPALGMDRCGLAAVAAHLDGLEALSRERVGAELTKLLAAPDPAMAVAAMRTAGVLARVLPGADDRALGLLVHLETEHSVAPDPIRRFAALADDAACKSLRLSKAMQTRWALLRREVESTKTPAHLGYEHGASIAMDVLLLRSALLEQALPVEQIIESKQAQTQVFPIKAKDLKDRFEGPALGAKLKELEARWIASGFTLGKDALLG